MFKEKSQDELSAMTEAEVVVYFNQMSDHKNQALKSAIEKGFEDKVLALKNEIVAINDKKMEAMMKSLESQGLVLQKMLSGSNGEVLAKDSLASKAQDLKDLKEKGVGKVFVEKSMTIAVNAPTYTQGYVDPTVTRLPERRPFIQSLLSSRTLSATGNVIYFEQANRVGDAGVTAEGVLKNNLDSDLVEVRVSAKKVTAKTKVSNEMIDDIPYVESMIREDLMKRVALKVDSQVLTGSGVGANLTGIFTTATAFNPTPWALSVVNANQYDVLALAVTQVLTQDFIPNYILLNPIDVSKMDIAKTTSGEYVMPAFVTAGGREIKATPVIVNNGITAGQYMVMDSTAAEVYTRSALTISIGYENDDFTKNMITMLAEWRGLCVVKSNNAGAFVKGVFATDIAAILKP